MKGRVVRVLFVLLFFLLAFSLVSAWGIMDIFSSPQLAPADNLPGGYFDVLDSNNNYVAGWAYDPDSPSQPIDVHIWATMPSGERKFVTGGKANQERADLASLNIGINHGFKFDIPAEFRINGTRFEALAINYPTNSMHSYLTNSPKTYISVQPIAPAPQTINSNNLPGGSFDVLDSNNNYVAGWAYDPEAGQNSIDVHIWASFPNGSRVFVTGGKANQERADLASLNIGINHGFKFDIPAEFRINGTRFEALAINYPDYNLNAYLANSPRPYVILNTQVNLPASNSSSLPVVNLSLNSSVVNPISSFNSSQPSLSSLKYDFHNYFNGDYVTISGWIFNSSLPDRYLEVAAFSNGRVVGNAYTTSVNPTYVPKIIPSDIPSRAFNSSFEITLHINNITNGNKILLYYRDPFAYTYSGNRSYIFLSDNISLPITDRIPLYKLTIKNPSGLPTVTFVSNEPDKNKFIQQGWKDEGIFGYILSNYVPGSWKLYTSHFGNNGDILDGCYKLTAVDYFITPTERWYTGFYNGPRSEAINTEISDSILGYAPQVRWTGSNSEGYKAINEIPAGMIGLVESVKIGVMQRTYRKVGCWEYELSSDLTNKYPAGTGYSRKPLAFVYPSSSSGAPTGYLDVVDGAENKIIGWAYDPDSPSQPIDVHIWATMPSGERKFVTGGKANQERADLASLNIGINHGFKFDIPAEFWVGGVKFEAYGLNIGGSGNAILGNSPKAYSSGKINTVVSSSSPSIQSSSDIGTTQSPGVLNRLASAFRSIWDGLFG